MSASNIANRTIALLTWTFLQSLIVAQTPTGEITGTVTDTSGAVVVDATVTVTNTATNIERVAKTNGSGIYDMPALPPGNYILRVEKEGFSAEVRTGIDLQVAQVARFDTSLKIGNVNQTVEVKGGAPLLETEGTAVGTVIENRRIVELPLNGRNYLSLTALTPGVTTSAPINNVAAARLGGLRASFTVSAGGERIYFNHYTLDGMENTESNFNAFLFLPSLDALQEFKVETGIFPAEYGHNLTQINVTTKSGANQFHGSLFEFLRNSAISAKNYFDSHTAPIPPFKRNQYGATIGGPIKKDRVFFFFDWEGLRERKSITKTSTVPSAAWQQGNFSGVSTTIYDPSTRVYSYDANGNPIAVKSATPYQGNMIPQDKISKITTLIFQKWGVVPNIGGPFNTGANNYVTSLLQPTNNDQENIRADYVQSTNSTWMFRYAHTGESQSVPLSLPHQGNNVFAHAHQGMLGNTWVSGGNKVNDLKLGVSYLANLNASYHACTENVVAELGVPGYPTPNCIMWGVPSVGYGIGEVGSGPFDGWNGMGQASDNFSWIRGKHAFKFGADVSRVRFNGIDGTYSAGFYTASGQFTTSGAAGAAIGPANTFADLLLGDFAQTSGLFGQQIFNYRWTYIGAYVEDSWKITPKLTVNYGLRWEDQTPPVDKNDAIVNVDFRWDNSVSPVLVRAGKGDPFAGSQGYAPPASVPLVRDGRFGNSLFRNDPFNFGPRLGVAYAFNAKTVIRAGAGMFYAHDIGNGPTEATRNLPFSLVERPSSNPVFPTLTWQNLFPSPLTPNYIVAVETKMPTSRVAQWSFGVQRQLSANSLLEVTYLGTAGMYLPRLTTYNTAPPGPGSQIARLPYPQLGGGVLVLTPQVHSSYEVLQARFEQRFNHGFTFLSSFNFGKSIDNGSSLRPELGEGGTRNPNNTSDIRGLSSFDFRRRWANSFLYEMPIGRGRALLGNANPVLNAVVSGWQIGGIFTMQDGQPFSPICTNFSTYQNGGQPLDTGYCYPKATGIDPNLPEGQQSPTHWFNTAAFVNQTPYNFGNAGRNTIIGPGIIDLDASITKNFFITERQRLEFRAECFNVGNHPLYGTPGATVGTATYGVISSTIIDSREFQFGLKYSF
jgi:hypothetical protein